MFDNDLFRRRLAFVRLGGEVERWHAKRTLQMDTVGHHSFNLIWLLELLTPGWPPPAKYRLIRAGMLHDTPEHILGDIPAMTKRRMGGPMLNDYETELLRDVAFDGYMDLSEEESRLLKLADKLEGAFYCVGELSLGNRRMEDSFVRSREWIDEQINRDNPCEVAVVEYLDDLWNKWQ